MRLATPLSLERLCRLTQVSRAGYYRWQHASPMVDADLELRDEIQRIALEFPSYGWPRITAVSILLFGTGLAGFQKNGPVS